MTEQLNDAPWFWGFVVPILLPPCRDLAGLSSTELDLARAVSVPPGPDEDRGVRLIVEDDGPLFAVRTEQETMGSLGDSVWNLECERALAKGDRSHFRIGR